MPRPFAKLTRHALPALAAVVVSLAVPLLAGTGDVTATATNVSGFAAQETQDGGGPGDELFPVGSAAFATARSIADAHWGASACKGEVAISWVSLDPGTNATASWRNPSDAWNNPGENFDCAIELNAAVDFDLPKLCTVLAHELGHLLGQQHAAQRGQLMSPIYSEALPACAAASPAPAPAPSAPATTPAPAPARTAAPSTRPTVKTFVRTTTTAKGVKVTDDAGAKRTLRRTSTRCVRVLRAGRRVKRCTRVVRRTAAPAAARRR